MSGRGDGAGGSSAAGVRPINIPQAQPAGLLGVAAADSRLVCWGSQQQTVGSSLSPAPERDAAAKHSTMRRSDTAAPESRANLRLNDSGRAGTPARHTDGDNGAVEANATRCTLAVESLCVSVEPWSASQLGAR